MGEEGLWAVPDTTGEMLYSKAREILLVSFCILFVAKLKNFNVVFLVIILCEWVSLTHISVHHLQASQTRVIYMLYTWLGITMWLLGTKPGSSGKEAGTLTAKPSLQPLKIVLNQICFCF